MCIEVQPVCNACKANALPVKLHECIFRDCKYPEKRTRFLTRDELHEFLKDGCSTPGCGLNMETINGRLAEIDRMLRMDEDPPPQPAEGISSGSRLDLRAVLGTDPRRPPIRRRLLAVGPPVTSNLSISEDMSWYSTTVTHVVEEPGNLRTISSDGQASPRTRGHDGDGNSHTHTAETTAGLNATAQDNGSPNDGVTTNDEADTDEAVNYDIADINESSDRNGKPVSNDDAAGHDDAARNDSSAASDNAAADSSVQTIFDPDSVDLDTFPRCRSCFLGRRRCDGRTPCNKCRQRRCSRACRPVTVDLLRQYPARAERVLELARSNGASS